MQGKFNFLKLHKVILRNFSLYSKGGKAFEVDEEINTGVYCLAGANGLGKTTFLNAINYGLTGIVLDSSNREVFIPNEIIKQNKKYTERYFKGRIKSEDEKKASIELLISISDKFIKITRGFLNREDIKELQYYQIINGKKKTLLNELKSEEASERYNEAIIRETGFNSFDYFLFYQLYVLTFDENRRLLFWDRRASTTAMAIAFNEDPNDTEIVLGLKKEMEEFESYGRNARWQATQVKKEIDKLIETNKQNTTRSYAILENEYFELHKNIDNQENIYNEIKIEYDTLLKQQNIVNSEILNLKVKYKKIFSQYSEPRSKLTQNPLIQIAKKENKCFVCGTHSHQAIESMERKMFTSSSCPVCDTPIHNENKELQENLMKQIKEIDKILHTKTNELEYLLRESETKKIEFDKAEIELNNLRIKLAKFESENSGVSFDRTGNTPIDGLISEYEKQYIKFDKQAKDYYSKRDKILPEYENLIKKVDKGFKEAKESFVPIFKQIARNFIGMELNIIAQKQGRELLFVFDMKGTARTTSYQVSESQRFFLDIALRMALAIHLSNKQSPSTLLIDTPEGSLDIAYESRVGNMFAEFVTQYSQNILMTANINASQLLVSLAEKCKNQKMEFRRMLDWTDMNQIQKEGEHLFNNVYKTIETKLNSKQNG